MKKTFLFVLLILGNCLLEACCDNEDECFDIELKSIMNFSLSGNFSLADSDTVWKKDFALLLDADANEELCSVDYNLGNSVYAFDCDDPLYHYADEVINISIKSNADLNGNYLAGSELKELFKPYELKRSCLGKMDNSNACLRDYSIFEGINSLEDAFTKLMAENFYWIYKNDSDIQMLSLFALKTDELLDANRHQFTISFEFKSGKISELKTEYVYII